MGGDVVSAAVEDVEARVVSVDVSLVVVGEEAVDLR